MRSPVHFGLALMFSMAGMAVNGNNILVENVSLEDQVAAEHCVYIEFDLSWDNSWRTSAVPDNWDAAWVFCKYKLAGTSEWHHIYLHPDGFSGPEGVTLSVSGDTTGAFVYRSTNGSGPVDFNDIRFRWNYNPESINDDASLEIKVFAIEMVYIRDGSFYLGDSTSTGRFYMGNNNKSFYPVSSENAITVSGTGSNLWAGVSISSGTIPTAYPKGYDDFYVMKYEISQEQYVDFLNCLTREQQNSRTQTDISGTSVTETFVMSNMTSMYARNGIRCSTSLPESGPVTFFNDYHGDFTGNQTDDGQNISCNYIGWLDIASYLDWSGLRPMTELEFEKACRGPNNPVGGEYAWGNASLHASPYTVNNAGMPNEMINSLPQYTGNCLCSSTFPSTGYVIRCGIFAASSVNHTRMETGATYYGVMEMSGNVWELCVNAYNLAGRSFTGLHGNGELLADGSADVSYWPGMNGNDSETYANGVYTSSGVTNQAGIGARGSESVFNVTGLPVSYRGKAAGSVYMTRTWDKGGRGCRTAP